MSVKKILQSLEEQKQTFLKQWQQVRKEVLEINCKAKSRFCYQISAGHGAIDPNTGKYTTGNAKRFSHPQLIKQGIQLHKGVEFLEGVFNRIIAEKVILLLKKRGIIYRRVYHEYLDIPVWDRKNDINKWHHTTQKSIALDIHSNASKHHNARGVSIWTSVGPTKSDLLAEQFWHIMERKGKPFVNRGYRMMKQEYKDGDKDYEKNFTFVRHTDCEAVLFELGFFDNPDDVLLLIDEKVQNMFAESIVEGIEWREQQNY